MCVGSLATIITGHHDDGQPADSLRHSLKWTSLTAGRHVREVRRGYLDRAGDSQSSPRPQWNSACATPRRVSYWAGRAGKAGGVEERLRHANRGACHAVARGQAEEPRRKGGSGAKRRHGIDSATRGAGQVTPG